MLAQLRRQAHSEELHSMASRRRHPHRRKSFHFGYDSIAVRVCSRRSARKFRELHVSGPKDAGRFARLVEDQVRVSPGEPLIVAVNGYQPWLGDILESCFRDCWTDVSGLDREVQFAGTMQFPEKASTRGQSVPWTFVLDQMNVPQVYYWSVNVEPPHWNDTSHLGIEDFRFRVGVWQKGQGACLFDRAVCVTIIFTRPTEVCEHVVTELLFDFLYKDNDFNQPRGDEEGICWLFLRLYWLLTDWQNIISQIVTRLEEAETTSQHQDLSVKMRARMMHNEVDRIYEMKEFLHFHSRSLKKLLKLKESVSMDEQGDPLWTDMEDAVEDLAQHDYTTDGLKERFNNLIELEFNIQDAVQANNSRFLAIIATVFLPVSFMASLFGMTTITWPAIYYIYVAVPLLVVCTVFVALFPWGVSLLQKVRYPVEKRRIDLEPRSFTMLGDDLPDSADIPGSLRSTAGGRRRSRRSAGTNDVSRARLRSQSRLRGEKEDH